MRQMYSTGKICALDTRTMQENCKIKWDLSKKITGLLANSRDYELLQYIWEKWRDTVGKPMKDAYRQFVQLSNEGARNDTFNDTGAWWRNAYEDDTFQSQLENLWREMLPLYEQLHTYV